MPDLHGFNAHEVEPAVGFEALPAGKYLAMITESEFKPTRNGNSEYLQLTFEILEGPAKGRCVWARLNVNHPKELAVRIARAELSAICRAVGVMQPRDSVELHNIPLVITLRCAKRADNDEITNEIKGYEKAGTGTPPTLPPNVAQPAVNPIPPWRR